MNANFVFAVVTNCYFLIQVFLLLTRTTLNDWNFGFLIHQLIVQP